MSHNRLYEKTAPVFLRAFLCCCAVVVVAACGCMFLPEAAGRIIVAVLSLAVPSAVLFWTRRSTPTVIWRRITAVTVDTALLMTGRHRIRAAAAPLETVGEAKANAGPAMLSLVDCAMLTIDPDTVSESERAILRFLSPMKADQDMIRLCCPHLGDVERDGITWQIHRDGAKHRAFACAPMNWMVPACEYIRLEAEERLTGEHRAILEQLGEGTTLMPLAFATAPMTDGKLGEGTLLGVMIPERELKDEAFTQAEALREEGIALLLTGSGDMQTELCSRKLHCEVTDEPQGLYLATDATQEENVILCDPTAVCIAEPLAEAMQLQHTMSYFHLFGTLTAAVAVLSGIVLGLQPVTLSLVTLWLLLPSLLYVLTPRRLKDDIYQKKAHHVLSLAVMLVLAALLSLMSGAGEAGLCFFAGLYPALLYLYTCDDIVLEKPLHALLVCSPVLLLPAALLLGAPVLNGVFLLLGGLLGGAVLLLLKTVRLPEIGMKKKAPAEIE